MSDDSPKRSTPRREMFCRECIDNEQFSRKSEFRWTCGACGHEKRVYYA